MGFELVGPRLWDEVSPLTTDAGVVGCPVQRRSAREAAAPVSTLTNLYNQRPAWLAQAHAALDAAVAAAYGWADWRADLPDDEILRRLLALNRARAGDRG